MSYIRTRIETNRLTLKVIDETFAERVLVYYQRNKDFLKKWEPTRGEEFFQLETHINQLKSDMSKINAGEAFRVWIFSKEDRELTKVLGSIGLSNIVRGCFHSCHLGYKLEHDEINKGLMTEALQAIITFVFQELQLHRIEANIIPTNHASLRVVEKLGFYHEGLAIKYLKINGVWEDHIHMVLRNEDME